MKQTWWTIRRLDGSIIQHILHKQPENCWDMLQHRLFALGVYKSKNQLRKEHQAVKVEIEVEEK